MENTHTKVKYSGECKPNRFGQVDSDKDSLVSLLEYNEFKMLLMGDNKGDEQREVVSFYKDLGTGEMSNITVAKLSSHGNDWGTTTDLG